MDVNPTCDKEVVNRYVDQSDGIRRGNSVKKRRPRGAVVQELGCNS